MEKEGGFCEGVIDSTEGTYKFCLICWKKLCNQNGAEISLLSMMFISFSYKGDKVTVKIGKEGSKESMKKVLKKDQVSYWNMQFSRPKIFSIIIYE